MIDFLDALNYLENALFHFQETDEQYTFLPTLEQLQNICNQLKFDEGTLTYYWTMEIDHDELKRVINGDITHDDFGLALFILYAYQGNPDFFNKKIRIPVDQNQISGNVYGYIITLFENRPEIFHPISPLIFKDISAIYKAIYKLFCTINKSFLFRYYFPSEQEVEKKTGTSINQIYTSIQRLDIENIDEPNKEILFIQTLVMAWKTWKNVEVDTEQKNRNRELLSKFKATFDPIMNGRVLDSLLVYNEDVKVFREMNEYFISEFFSSARIVRNFMITDLFWNESPAANRENFAECTKNVITYIHDSNYLYTERGRITVSLHWEILFQRMLVQEETYIFAFSLYCGLAVLGYPNPTHMITGNILELFHETGLEAGVNQHHAEIWTQLQSWQEHHSYGYFLKTGIQIDIALPKDDPPTNRIHVWRTYQVFAPNIRDYNFVYNILEHENYIGQPPPLYPTISSIEAGILHNPAGCSNSFKEEFARFKNFLINHPNGTHRFWSMIESISYSTREQHTTSNIMFQDGLYMFEPTRYDPLVLVYIQDNQNVLASAHYLDINEKTWYYSSEVCWYPQITDPTENQCILQQLLTFQPNDCSLSLKRIIKQGIVFFSRHSAEKGYRMVYGKNVEDATHVLIHKQRFDAIQNTEHSIIQFVNAPQGMDVGGPDAEWFWSKIQFQGFTPFQNIENLPPEFTSIHPTLNNVQDLLQFIPPEQIAFHGPFGDRTNGFIEFNDILPLVSIRRTDSERTLSVYHNQEFIANLSAFQPPHIESPKDEYIQELIQNGLHNDRVFYELPPNFRDYFHNLQTNSTNSFHSFTIKINTTQIEAELIIRKQCTIYSPKIHKPNLERAGSFYTEHWNNLDFHFGQRYISGQEITMIPLLDYNENSVQHHENIPDDALYDMANQAPIERNINLSGFFEVLQDLFTRRGTISLNSFQKIMKILLWDELFIGAFVINGIIDKPTLNQYVKLLTRLWQEAGFIDVVQKSHGSGKIVVPRKPELHVVKTQSRYQATWTGFISPAICTQLQECAVNKTEYHRWMDPNSPNMPSLLRVYGTKEEIKDYYNAALGIFQKYMVLQPQVKFHENIPWLPKVFGNAFSNFLNHAQTKQENLQTGIEYWCNNTRRFQPCHTPQASLLIKRFRKLQPVKYYYFTTNTDSICFQDEHWAFLYYLQMNPTHNTLIPNNGINQFSYLINTKKFSLPLLYGRLCTIVGAKVPDSDNAGITGKHEYMFGVHYINSMQR